MNLTFFVIIGLCVFAVAVHGQKEPRKVLVPFIYKAEAFLDLDENAKIMYTSGLVDGFLASSLFGASDETVTDVKACLKNMDTTQLAAIFTKYVKENPEGWQNPTSVLGFNALVGTCPGVIKITWIRDEETRATSSPADRNRRHTFDTFVDTPPSIAQGGNGVVTPGCPACRKRLFTMANFMDHLADDVLPTDR
jgi:hypothetical protein